MKYADEFLLKIKSLGALGYPIEKVLNCVDVENENQFRKDFDDTKSEIFKAYQKGKDMADYEIDMALFTQARSGDIKAIEKFEIRKKILQKKSS
jgi:hypothetical protein